VTRPFLVPDDFRAFMKSVVNQLDHPRPGLVLDVEDAFDAECGYGGRVGGAGTYLFRYLTKDGLSRWEIVLDESQIRDIADGLLIEVDGEPYDLSRLSRRQPVGDPLLVWGEYPEDALRVRSDAELVAALDALHATSLEAPRLLRMWTDSDDQLVAVLWGDRCALYVVESPDGYATSMGDIGRTESFEVHDHEGRVMTVPLADCVSWDYARRAILRFVDHSDLGDIPVEGRIPSLLLMMGEIDRKAMLVARPDVATELSRTSLRPSTAVPVPVADEEEITAPVEPDPPLGPLELANWARRVIEHLHSRALVELGPGANLDELGYQLGGLLQAHASDAEHDLDTADWLANEIGALHGIRRLFATGTDLQVAMRRSRVA
jgi:hypothetical protein